MATDYLQRVAPTRWMVILAQKSEWLLTTISSYYRPKIGMATGYLFIVAPSSWNGVINGQNRVGYWLLIHSSIVLLL